MAGSFKSFSAGFVLCLILGVQVAIARSDGSFPGKGSYTAWVSANGLLKFGNDFAERGDLDKALEFYKQAIHTYAYDSIYYFNVGNAFSRKGQFSIAEESYRKAIDLEPDYFQAWLNLGHTIARQGRHLEAAKALKHAAKLSQNPVERSEIDKTITQFEQMPSLESPPTPEKEGKKRSKRIGMANKIRAWNRPTLALKLVDLALIKQTFVNWTLANQALTNLAYYWLANLALANRHSLIGTR